MSPAPKNLQEPFGADHAGEVSRDGGQEGDAEVGEEHGEVDDRGRDACDQADGTEGTQGAEGQEGEKGLARPTHRT